MLEKTRTAGLRQLARVNGQVDANRMGEPGAKEEVKDVLREVNDESTANMPQRTATLKALGKAWNQFKQIRPNKATIKAQVAVAIGLIRGEAITPVEPPPHEEEPPPPPPPPPDEHFGLPLLYHDAFPKIGSPFVLGGDNQDGACVGVGPSARIHLTGERFEFSCYTKPGTSNDASWGDGDEYAFLGGFAIGSDLQWGGGGHHCTMFQLSKGIGSGGGGSPLQSLELGDYGAGKGIYMHDQNHSQQYAKIASINPNQHYRLGIHELMKHSGGFYEISLDGSTIAKEQGVPTMQPGSEAVVKFGLYGGGGTITWDDCAIYART